MSSLLLNRAKANTTTTGTGAVTPGSAVSPYQSWASAGAVTGRSYEYLIEDGAAWELGVGVYNGTTITRPGPGTDPAFASSSGSLLNLSGSATVACVANKDDNKWNLLASWDFSVSGTVSSVVADVGGCADLMVLGRLITLASSGYRGVQVSTNGGTSYYNGASDYVVPSTAGAETTTWIAMNHGTATTAARDCGGTILGISQKNCPKWMLNSIDTGGNRLFVADQVNPIDHVRVCGMAAAAGATINMTGGQVWIWGR